MSKHFLHSSPSDKRRFLGGASHIAEKYLQKGRAYVDSEDEDIEVEIEGESLPELNVEVANSSTTLETTEGPQPSTAHTPVDDSAALQGSTAGVELISDEIGLDCQPLDEDNPSNEDSSLNPHSTDSISPSTPQTSSTHTPVYVDATLRGSSVSDDGEYVVDEIVLDCQPSTEDTPTNEDILPQPLSMNSFNSRALQANIQYTSNNASASNRDSPDSNSTAVTTETSCDTKVIEAAKAGESPVPAVTKPPAQENAEPLDTEIVQTDQPQKAPHDLLPVNESFNSWLSGEVKAEPPEPAQALLPSTGNSKHRNKQVDESLTRFRIAEKIAEKYPLRQMNENMYLHQHGKM